MNRRKLLAGAAIGVTSIAGCYSYNQAQSTEDTGGSSGGGTETGDEDPSIPADEADSTDTPPEEREETTPEEEGQSDSADTEEDTDAETPPDMDPKQAIKITDHRMIFEEATDPNYEQDQLYLQGTIQNTTGHPLSNIRLDGFAYDDSGTELGSEFVEYAHLNAGETQSFELPFIIDEPASAEEYSLEVTAAEFS